MVRKFRSGTVYAHIDVLTYTFKYVCRLKKLVDCLDSLAVEEKQFFFLKQVRMSCYIYTYYIVQYLGFVFERI